MEYKLKDHKVKSNGYQSNYITKENLATEVSIDKEVKKFVLNNNKKSKTK